MMRYIGICILSLLLHNASAQVSTSIGTIQPGDSIQVYFHVKVDNPLPGCTNTISTQGTAAGTGFSQITDDPATGGLNDATVTNINRVPTFTSGASTTLSTCQDAAAVSINSLLTASDCNTGQTMTWSVQSGPTHGSLGGFTTTASSALNVTPTGLTYQPTAGYSGSDAFTIRIADGNDFSDIVVNVTVNAAIANNTIGSNQTVCTGNTPNQLNGALPTGGGGGYVYAWEMSTTGPSSGFSAAGGVNNTQNYQPGSISVPTWFRRVVTTAIGCQPSTSAAVAISVTTNNSWNGASNFQWSNAGNWTCGTVPTVTTDVIINSGYLNAPFVDITNAVGHTLSIGTGAVLEFSGTASRLDIYGPITVNGTFDALPGTVAFHSSTAQNIPAGSYTNIILNGVGLKTLDGAVSVENQLTLTSGDVQLGSSNLTVQSTGSISGGSSSSFVVVNGSGKLVQQGIGSGGRTGDILFPIGNNSSSYTPASVNNAGTIDNFSASVIDNVYTAYTGDVPSGSMASSAVVNKTWLISEGSAGGSNASLSLTWNMAEEGAGFIRSNCLVSHYTGGGWVPGTAGPASGSNPFTQSTTGITSFSPFAIGSNGSPLPVHLTDVSAINEGDRNRIEWHSALETGLVRYELERSSDGQSFNHMTDVAATGHASGYLSYDYDPTEGLTWYRLKMILQSGAPEYSQVVQALRKTAGASIAVYPNPVSDVLNVEVYHTGSTASVKLTDLNGRTIMPLILVEGKAKINMTGLAAGVYLVQLTNGANTQSIRVTKQ